MGSHQIAGHEVSGTRKGKNHSKGCCERFWNWTKATDSDEPVRDLPLFSIKFATNATSVVVPFGNFHIRIWEPESSVDDTTLKELSGESALLG